MSPGIHYKLPMPHYLRLRALSAGVLTTLIDRCPMAAWFESPWNPQFQPDDSKEADNGTVAHAILLEGAHAAVDVFNPADYPNAKGEGVATGWTNKAIREARDRCRLAGRIPVLASQMAEIEAMAHAARKYVDSLKDSEPAIWRAFQPEGGDSEVTLIWNDDLGQACRARPDRLSKDGRLVVDAKFLTTDVAPESFGRGMWAAGYPFRAAFYRQGLRSLLDVESEYVFLLVEQSPPHLCSMIGVDPMSYAYAEEEINRARAAWRECQSVQVFPGYPNRVCYPEMPPWVQKAIEDRQYG